MELQQDIQYTIRSRVRAAGGRSHAMLKSTFVQSQPSEPPEAGLRFEAAVSSFLAAED